MKDWSLRVAAFALPLASIGCGYSPSAKTTLQAPACTPSAKPVFAYVLSSEIVPWGNETISSYGVNSCTGGLTPTSQPTIATGSDPEDLVVDPLGRFVYAANLVSNATDLATISMYTINPDTGNLTPTTPPAVGTGFFPQGIGIDPSGKFVYTANSDDNTLSMFTINQSTGVLTPTTPPTIAAGQSPVSVAVDPSGKFAYAVNQDDGTISMYMIDPNTGLLTPTTPASIPGYSPFDITVDPSGKFAYVPNAYGNNEVSEFTIDSSTGILSPTEQVEVQAGNSPTNVAVNPSGAFAYVVDREANTVSAFSIQSSTGDLTPIGNTTTGQQPWRAAVDPSGDFLYVGNEGDSTVSIYNIGSDGSLISGGLTAATPGAVYAIGIVSPAQ